MTPEKVQRYHALEAAVRSDAAEPILEGDPALRPSPPDRPYTDVFDFLEHHGVNLETRPKVRSFKSAEEAMKYILKTAIIEVEKGD
jgi:hypothetical protein